MAKEWRATENGREYTKRANHSDRQRATSSKYDKSDKGKAAKKRQNDKPLNNIRKRLYKLTKNSKYESDTLRKLNGITNEAFCARLQSTFKPWMTWDNHGNVFNTLKDRLLPPLDQGVAALLDDLDASGRLDDTLVMMLGEFGRTPKINKGQGRDHWGPCFFGVFAGAGVQGGQVIGKSDSAGA